MGCSVVSVGIGRGYLDLGNRLGEMVVSPLSWRNEERLEDGCWGGDVDGLFGWLW